MTSIEVRLHNIIKPSKNSFQFQIRTFSPSYISTQHQFHQYPLYTFHSKPLQKPKIPPLSLRCSLSSPSPPTSKEEAVLQAKTCLSTTLQKPLNNPKLAGKLKKLKQPRYRLEIPVIDDSPSSLSQLALNLFGEMPIRRKGSAVKILLIWPNPTLTEAAIKAFGSCQQSNSVEHMDISLVSSAEPRITSSADLAVFLAPEASQLEVMETVTDSLYPRPVVVFNPKWDFEQESSFGELCGFVGSFEVVYSFMGLEVRGLLSKRQGVVFKCVRDGVLIGERWSVLVEEEGKLRVVSRFKNRPSIIEVENVLYNLMAINSPITKSAKFLKDMISNVTGKK